MYSTINRGENKYPNIDAPFIHYKGDISLLDGDITCVIGRRSMSDQDAKNSYWIGRDLAKRGRVVLNGLAIGCDTEVVRGALSANGKVIGVMPCSLDKTYPSSNRELAEDILKKGGCLISEYDTPEILKHRFLERDELQVQLSNRVIIVAANTKGGSVYTANYAKRKGLPVGSLATTDGGNSLINGHVATRISGRKEYEEFIAIGKGRTDYEAQMKDGRLTEPSNFNYAIDIRKAIELSKQKGRPLTEDEVDALRRGLSNQDV